MARLPRLNWAGSPQHVNQRGNNRAACFFSEADYRAYLHWLAEAAQRSGVLIHAYVLMTNHVHLLATPSDMKGISRLMQCLGRHYVNYVNRLYRRSGTLWEGRFKACAVESESYLLTVHRYIEHNPVRAGMVASAEEYRWSSARAHLCGERDWLLSEHEEFLRLGISPEERAQAYRAICVQTLDEAVLADLRTVVNKGHAFGSERFKDQIEAATNRRVRPGRTGRPPRKDDLVPCDQIALDI